MLANLILSLKITGVLIIVFLVMAIYACCVVAGQADNRIEEIRENKKSYDYCDDDCYICDESGSCMFSEYKED